MKIKKRLLAYAGILSTALLSLTLQAQTSAGPDPSQIRPELLGLGTNFNLAVTASPLLAGIVTGGGVFSAGSLETITATPLPGYAFVDWSGGATGSNSTLTVTLNTNLSVTANFVATNSIITLPTNYTVVTLASPLLGGLVTGSGLYSAGSQQAITATPSLGYAFVNWSGNASGTNNPLTVTVSTNLSITANFSQTNSITNIPTDFTLVVTPSPVLGGLATGSGVYAAGSQQSVTATPLLGYGFTGWSGNASGTNNPLTVTMSTNLSITANFTLTNSITNILTNFTLVATPSPILGGLVTGSGIYAAGSQQSVMATPLLGYGFTGWSGNASGTNNPLTVTMSTNLSITANFTLTNSITNILTNFTLVATPSPILGGFVTGSGIYAAGSQQSVTATALLGYGFTGWSGNASGTNNPLTVTMSTNLAITANFTLTNAITNILTNFTLVATPSPILGGLVTGSGIYAAGSQQSVTATPLLGYGFTGWSGNASGTNNPLTITMTTNLAITANFSLTNSITNIPTNFSLVVTPSPLLGGLVTGSGIYVAGSQQSVTATPLLGYGFTGWSGNASGTNNPLTVTMTTNLAITANFTLTNSITNIPTNFSLVVTPSPLLGGLVTGSGIYVSGSQQSVTATPLLGYGFTGWSGNASGTNNPLTVTMTTNLAITANFTLTNSITNILTNFTLFVSVSPALSGSVTGSGTFLSGSQQLLTAVANTGYAFAGWSSNVVSTNNPLTVTLLSNLSLVANFIATNLNTNLFTNCTLTLIASPTNGGVVLGTGIFLPGSQELVTAIANPGYSFSYWSGNASGTNNPLDVVMTSNLVITANFVPAQLKLFRATYNGIFCQSNGMTHTTAGMIKNLVVNKTGFYAGTLMLAGQAFPIAGQFLPNGSATKRIPRNNANGGAIELDMELSANGSSAILTGTVSSDENGVQWQSQLIAYPGAAAYPPARYVVLFHPDTNNAPPNYSPGGTGFAVITNFAQTGNGLTPEFAVINARLADGTAFQESVTVSCEGYLPVYHSLYGGRGMIVGWLNFSMTNEAGVGLTWIHPATSGGPYERGFTNILGTNEIMIAPWSNPLVGASALTNLTVLPFYGDTNDLDDISVTVTANGSIRGGLVEGIIHPVTGLFNIVAGRAGDQVIGYGVFNPSQTNGEGFFLTQTNSCALLLSR